MSVDERGSSAYAVALASEPTGTVAVAISATAGTDLMVNPTALTVTDASWNQAHTVTVMAGQDTDRLDDEQTLAHAASGGDYGSVSADLPVTLSDDDVPTIVAN